ncbi:Lipoprotein-releasing system transmembrane protein LolC [Gammaproteobacteria bacterium]
MTTAYIPNLPPFTENRKFGEYPKNLEAWNYTHPLEWAQAQNPESLEVSSAPFLRTIGSKIWFNITMLHPLEIFIGLRYTRAKRRTRFISFITASSMLGVALGVAALITVLSVMNGFEQELRHRILGMIAHATVTGPDEHLTDWHTAAMVVARDPQVSALAPYVEGQGMLVEGPVVTGVTVRGVLPEQEPAVSAVAAKLQEGQLTDLRPGTFGVLLGRDLALHLGVTIGDKVTLVTPQAMVTPVGLLPRLKRFTVVGIFQVGMYEYDSALAITHLQDAARLFRFGVDEVSGLRLALTNLDEAPVVTHRLAGKLPPSYRIADWTTSHASFFHAVHTEQTVMFVILTLIVAVAAFNIVSMLVMVVTDKEPDIAILRTLGLTPGAVMRIFVVQGSIIGLVGTALGLVGGIALATHVSTVVPALEHFFGVHVLSPDVYYITELPSDMHWADVIRIGITALVLCLLATLYPAWRASQVQPAAALRYE